MMRIGEFSSLSKTTVKTLRFYDEIDLFKPIKVEDNGYRYYSEEQLSALQKILDLRAMGATVEEVKIISGGGDVKKILTSRLQATQEEIARATENVSLIIKYLADAEKGVSMENYQAKEITLESVIVYYRHGVIASMAELVPFILGAGEEVRKNNPTLNCATPEYCFVTYGAEEYKETDVELEYAEAVTEFGKESENVKFKQLPKQKAISVLHKGAYSDMGKAYAFAINFVKENGYKIAAPIRERYIDGCWNKDDEKDYLSEIQIPVE